jgi:hypothetical protein
MHSSLVTLEVMFAPGHGCSTRPCGAPGFAPHQAQSEPGGRPNLNTEIGRVYNDLGAYYGKFRLLAKVLNGQLFACAKRHIAPAGCFARGSWILQSKMDCGIAANALGQNLIRFQGVRTLPGSPPSGKVCF